MQWRIRLTNFRMDILLQIILRNLVLGRRLRPHRLGYAMVYSIIQLINFAQRRNPPMVGRWWPWIIRRPAAVAITGMPSCPDHRWRHHRRLLSVAALLSIVIGLPAAAQTRRAWRR